MRINVVIVCISICVLACQGVSNHHKSDGSADLDEEVKFAYKNGRLVRDHRASKDGEVHVWPK